MRLNLLSRASAETTLEISLDLRRPGEEIGFFNPVPIWNHRLQRHPYLARVLAAGDLAQDHSQWLSAHSSLFPPVRIPGHASRGAFVAGLETAFRESKFRLHGHLIPSTHQKENVSFCHNRARCNRRELLMSGTVHGVR